MFRKYEKTYRILVPQISTKGKHYLSKQETQRLLGGQVVITEKIDGANVGIIRHKDEFRLQKRGSLVDASEHAQFNFFKAWSYENYDKLMQIPEGTVLYGELMFAKHTVFYNSLPDYFLAFAWCDRKTGEYYNWNEMTDLCDNIGLHHSPHIYSGPIKKDELFDKIPKKSAFSDEPAEGIVVWNYKKNMRGKVVRREFQKAMDQSGHWIHKSVTRNLLRKDDA